MNKNAVVVHARNGFLRFLEFIAWVVVIVTVFTFIGYSLSQEASFRTSFLFLAMFAIGLGTLLTVVRRIFVSHQRYVGIGVLALGALTFLLLK
ncbi:MAG TPA: hypothetical protein VNM40_01655 [Candidatus Paceibacterota bacterium]|nr:hypothetical protein [Candidatus Paceibacterota bacterium]